VADVAGLIDSHNRLREEMKLAPLKANPKLESAALAHARDMAWHEKMAHEGSDGSTPAQRIERQSYHYRATGENVAYGQDNVADVMRTWRESPPHKKNILGDFTEIGAACVKSKDGTPYWCVDFGLPWPEVDPEKVPGEVLAALNHARKEAKKPSLKLNAKLATAARRHVRELAEKDKDLSKDDQGLDPFARVKEAGYRFRLLGAMASSGQATPDEVARTWLENPSDRKNILGEFTEVGVGYAATEKGIPYWCLLLGKPAR
jgi:uncharacterized protein YkwD